MKNKQLLVLRELRKDARKTFTDIGKDLGIPVTTAYDHYKRLDNTVITKKVSLLDFNELGYKLRTFFIAKCFEIGKLLEFLKDHESMNSLFMIDEKTLLFEMIFKEIEDRLPFVKSLEDMNVKDLEEYPVFEEVEREFFVP